VRKGFEFRKIRQNKVIGSQNCENPWPWTGSCLLYLSPVVESGCVICQNYQDLSSFEYEEEFCLEYV
jgi:hypothetical protein